MPELRIEHHGARDGVTGSCHQLHLDQHNSLLVDCGLFQGAETGSGKGPHGHHIHFDISTVRALVATHVHIDHVGRVPWLLAAGFSGPVLCSEPSARLLPLVLEDAFRLAISRDRKLTERYLARVAERTIALPYKRWYPVPGTEGVRLRLQRAGHILGSAYVEVDCRGTRVVFSGDLGASHTPLLPAPRPPHRADILVLESTYGDRLHENRATRRKRLRAAIERALANQGTVLIPAFSIGRTQELLYELETFVDNRLPVILDSPLASRFTAAYRELKPYWDEEAHARLRLGHKPLSFDNLLTVESHAAHEKMVRHLAHSGRPAIVIAGSGMCNGGRIVNYLKAMLGDERHDVLFVGYQAEGTPGRDIQTWGPRGGYVILDGEKFHIRARVETIGGYSAHADQQGLVNFVKGMRHKPEEIRLVHGNAAAKQALKARLAPLLAPSARIHTHF